MKDYFIYDIETYKYLFCVVFKNIRTGELFVFEISSRRNQFKDLLDFLYNKVEGLIGFNNLNFDYPVLHRLFYKKVTNSVEIYYIADKVINSNWSRVNKDLIKIPQLDLFLIHHFDNKNRSASLKWCEFFLRWHNIADLPFADDLERFLSDEEMDAIITYCINDVEATNLLYEISKPKIKLREILTEKYNLDLMNANDPKIGSEIILDLYCKKTNKAKEEVKKLRTHEEIFHIKDLIFDYITFNSSEFKSFLSNLKEQVIYQTKDALKYHIEYKGFTYDYGTGGIHGCIKPGVYQEDDNFMIYDIDVGGQYPNLAVKNQYYIKHLGPEFLEVFEENIVNERNLIHKPRSKDKTLSPEEREIAAALSDGLKLGGNGATGKSNESNNFLYNPSYFLKTTLNGQLVLLMLAERLCDEIPDHLMLQINTDGLTIKIPREYEKTLITICKEWEEYTKLSLEYAKYKKMIIRDVNCLRLNPFNCWKILKDIVLQRKDETSLNVNA